MIKKLHPDSHLYGFLMGPHGVYSNNYIEIDHEYMELYRNMGGFDMICKYKKPSKSYLPTTIIIKFIYSNLF